MASQTIRPDGDVTLGGWDDGGGGTTNIYLQINEAAADDADYVETANNPSLDVCEFSLQNPTGIDTKDADGHTIDYRYAKSAAGGRDIEIRVRLLDNITEVASWTHSAVSNTVTEANQTLDSTQTSIISDWNDLRLEFRADTSGSGAARTGRVHWAQMTVNGTAAASDSSKNLPLIGVG